jgi:polyisoprenoid-binding protein YceI
MRYCRSLAAAAVILISLAGSARAETVKYTFDPNHTNVTFHANHFGFSNPSGRFGIVKGNLYLDEADPKASSVSVTIDVNSLVTGITRFNDHIKSADFLDAAKFPTATFKSDSVELTGKDTAKVRGIFTLHGVTKPIELDVKLNKLGDSPITTQKTAGFTASVTLKRSDYGVSKYVPGVSDDIRIDIEAEASPAQSTDPLR